MFPFFISKKSLDPVALSNLPKLNVGRYWDGSAVAAPINALVALDPKNLYFHGLMQKKPTLSAAHKADSFVEWLGEGDGDVIELYISHPKSGRYLELHIAPQAAWWMMEFEKRRTRSSTELKHDGVSCCSVDGSNSWSTTLTVPLVLLPNWFLPFSEVKANITSVIAKDEYLSAAPLPIGKKPDFHQPDNFLEIVELNLYY